MKQKAIYSGLLVGLIFLIGCDNAATVLFEENFDSQGDWTFSASATDPDITAEETHSFTNGSMTFELDASGEPDGSAEALATLAAIPNAQPLGSDSDLQVEMVINNMDHVPGTQEIYFEIQYGTQKAVIRLSGIAETLIDDVAPVTIVLNLGETPTLTVDGDSQDILGILTQTTEATSEFSMQFRNLAIVGGSEHVEFEIDSLKISAIPQQ